MPWGLRRYQQSGNLHFITFSCYRRRQSLDPRTRRVFERALERARIRYGFWRVAHPFHLVFSCPQTVGAPLLRGFRKGGHPHSQAVAFKPARKDCGLAPNYIVAFPKLVTRNCELHHRQYPALPSILTLCA